VSGCRAFRIEERSVGLALRFARLNGQCLAINNLRYLLYELRWQRNRCVAVAVPNHAIRYLRSGLGGVPMGLAGATAAGWHQSGQRLTIPSNVTLLRLPPLCPGTEPRSRTSGNICVATISVTSFGTHTSRSSRLAAPPGTPSSTIAKG
jgi:hypothetical protein